VTITYPLSFPETIGLTDAVLRMKTAVSMNESQFSYIQQVYAWSGERWEVDVSLPLMTRDQAEEYKSFFAKLRGKYGTFTIYVPSCKTNRGDYQEVTKQLETISGDTLTTISGDNLYTSITTPYAYSGTAGSRTLVITGLKQSTTGALIAGDYIQIGTGSNTRLYKILNTVNSNSNGQATVDIFPALRKTVTDGDDIVFENPKGLFRLSSNVTEFVSDYNNLFSLSFSAVEAINGT
jgi:hypothetical protein